MTLNAPGNTSPATPGNIFAQLAVLDAALFTTNLQQAHATVGQDIAGALIQTAPTTIEAASQVASTALAQSVSKQPPAVQQGLQLLGGLVAQSLATNFMNWIIGQTGGKAAKVAAEQSENAAGIQTPKQQGS